MIVIIFGEEDSDIRGEVKSWHVIVISNFGGEDEGGSQPLVNSSVLRPPICNMALESVS